MSHCETTDRSRPNHIQKRIVSATFCGNLCRISRKIAGFYEHHRQWWPTKGLNPLVLGQASLGLVSILSAHPASAAVRGSAAASVRKLEDIVIYEDAKFYAAFPSIVRRPNGELL